jgi:peroxiredoxin
MTDQVLAPLGPGDPAPDFDLPAADHDGRVALAEYLVRGPVLLYLLRGLYCPFCRRQISQMKPTCELLGESGVTLLGVVIAKAERSQLYYRLASPPCFPVAASPDRALHRAYGLTETPRTPQSYQDVDTAAARILAELGVERWSGRAAVALQQHDTAFQETPDDEAEYARPLQTSGLFLIDRDGVIRWTRVPANVLISLRVEELLALV